MASAADSDDSTRLNRAVGVRRRHCSFNAVVAALFLCLGSIDLLAQTNISSATPRATNRYLFIVETSRAMRPRARGVFEAVKQALDSSLNGQIHPGDLVGIWTFNENVYQELFPSQEWSQPTQLAFAVRLPTLSNPEIYLKRARLDKVIPEIPKVISESENVTLIFVSSGEGLMQGTPFSAQINSAWEEWHDELDAVHMPLLTALRTRNGQYADWLLTPAPRPIDLPALVTEPKLADEKETNASGVILESGLAPKTPEPIVLGPEQQVAFSVWALGKTGLVNAATSPQKVSTPKADDSPAPTTPTADVSVEHSKVQPLENESAKLAAAVVPSREQAKSESASPRRSEIEEIQIHNQTRVAASTSNEPPSEVRKPVELVFVTNAPAPAPIAPAPAFNSTQRAADPSSVAIVSPSLRQDISADDQLLAHAREAKPQEEKQTLDLAMAVPRRGFLRENVNPLALMIAAAFGAAYCFRMWFLTQARAIGNAMSLAHTSKRE